ncbi:hypothetical protein EDF75_4535 [Raoultella sp. BIGb0149]|uniref:hypothetical protein n=1 Tax=Raoultella TaxID=160674 RepID=UPI0010D15198|nr:hypothetical protein [Raoultella terrigena]TDQ20725.1 hypothetical protein EDF75_4535 [Raoultella sp. BIGb0149]
MAEQKTNALVLNGVNDDITELKSLTTLRKRLVSDGEIVSKAANGFRLASAGIQAASNLYSELYHYERLGKHSLMGMHVYNSGQHAWYEFLHTGNAYTNGTWNSGSDIRMENKPRC